MNNDNFLLIKNYLLPNHVQVNGDHFINFCNNSPYDDEIMNVTFDFWREKI
jgi:hypothetical protein